MGACHAFDFASLDLHAMKRRTNSYIYPSCWSVSCHKDSLGIGVFLAVSVVVFVLIYTYYRSPFCDCVHGKGLMLD